MELSQLANIGEFLGGVAVIVSLVYLAVQIRQNTLSVRATTFQATTELITDSTARIASDPELARIYAGGLSGAGDLSEIDRFRFGLLMVTVVRRLESAYFQREVGVLSEEQWSGIATVIPGLLTSEGGKAWWARSRRIFTGGFQAYVDEVLADPRAARAVFPQK